MNEAITPSDAVPPVIAPDTVRTNIPLPPSKPVGKRPLREDAQPDPAESFTALASYNAAVLARHAQVCKFFAASEDSTPGVDPTKSPEYNKFVQDHLAYLNMRFVTLGVFTTPTAADVTAGEHGGLAANPVREEFVPPEGLDPALARSNAARFAISAGADLVNDDGD
jgi:hypothetical protein